MPPHMGDLVGHIDSLGDLSRVLSNDDRRQAALTVAESVSETDSLISVLRCLGLAEFAPDGKLTSIGDGHGWFM